MAYCYKLNLPKWPIKHPKLRNFFHHNLWDVYTDVENILSDNILEKFNSVNVIPKMVVVFQSNHKIRDSAYVHSDLEWKDNKWTKVPCAVNWELQPITTTIRWYDTSNCTEYWPKESFEECQYPVNFLNGLSYTDTDNRLVEPEKSILLEQHIIDNKNPILFRTDVAHGVKFISKTVDRICVSVRFENITSWEDAVDLFENFILDK